MSKSNFKAPLIHSTQAAHLDKLDEQYGAQEKLDRAVTVASTYAATAIEKAPRYVENVTTDPRGAALALKAYAGASLARVGSRASSLAVSVLGEDAVEDAGTALARLFPESHRPEAKTLATSVALGLGGLAVGVPFVPGITDNLLVGGVGAALPFFLVHVPIQASPSLSCDHLIGIKIRDT